MVFVTGGTGMVGAHLLLELVQAGIKVRALKRESSNLSQINKIVGFYTSDSSTLLNQIEWVDGDLLDYDSIYQHLENITTIYNVAAIISFAPEDRYTMINNNVKGTANLVNAALDRKIKKICHVSSVSALGSTFNGDAVDEETPRKPSNHYSGYSLSKFNSELEVWRGMVEGLDAVIVNPSIIIGSGDWEKGSASIFSTIWKGLKFYSSGTTGYVDVRDVVKAMIALMNSDIKNERFIISSENLTYHKMFSMVSGCLKKPVPGFKANTLFLEIAWRLEWMRCKLSGRKPVITREMARSARKQTNYSNEKIKTVLNFKFITIEDSIKFHGKIFLKETNAVKT